MENEGLYCNACGLDNLTTSCGLFDCGLIATYNDYSEITDAVDRIRAGAVSLYERTGDIKDINTMQVPLALLKALYLTAESAQWRGS